DELGKKRRMTQFILRPRMKSSGNGITRKNANRFIDNLLAFSFYAICTTFAQLANRERKSRGIIPAILLF
ncbi:hypothetical protein, partial [Bacteroides sp. AF27-10BH]|uniref:hypothetical protein n=1 Tax=Bacteroides sp. AF27-10BH TaxID=2292927 RepID=UPI001A9FADEC